jgi:hypothetical protein
LKTQLDPDQVIEVPIDQYKEAVEVMRQRIQEGQVCGVTDPGRPEELGKEGSITNRQVLSASLIEIRSVLTGSITSHSSNAQSAAQWRSVCRSAEAVAASQARPETSRQW